MESINNFFSDLGGKMPFATEFFSRKISLGGTEISTMFIATLGALLVLITIVVCIVCAAKVSHAKQEAKKRNADTHIAPKQAANEEEPTSNQANIDEFIAMQSQFDEADQAPQEENEQPSEQAEDSEAEEPMMDTAQTDEGTEDAAADEEQPMEEEPFAQDDAQEEAANENAEAEEESNAESDEDINLFVAVEDEAETGEDTEEATLPIEEEYPSQSTEEEDEEESAPQAVEQAGTETADASNEQADEAPAEDEAYEEEDDIDDVDVDVYAALDVADAATDKEEPIEQPEEDLRSDEADGIQDEATPEAQSEVATEQSDEQEPIPLSAEEEQAPAVAETDIAALRAKAAPVSHLIGIPTKKTSGIIVATEDTNMKKEESKKINTNDDTTPDQDDKKAKKGLFGTFEVSLCLDGYRFCLYANNKQLMYESVGFTSIEGAMKGIETFRKTLQENPYIITRDKYGRFRYVFNKRYQGENYTSASAAQSAAESVKRWADNAKVIVRNPQPEEEAAYKKGLDSMRTKDDVDWDEVARVEASERKMGKFTVEEDGNGDEIIGYRFYLIANNAQILYTSAIYTSATGALKAIDTFKRAVYVGNFYLDKDKFGHYRYILRSNATTTYVGESYTSESSAKSSIESVKKFVKCATIVPFKKASDEE